MKMDGMQQKRAYMEIHSFKIIFNQKVKNQYPTLLLKKLQKK